MIKRLITHLYLICLLDLDGCHDLFRIDQSNGTVYTNTRNLDRDDKPINTISIDGVCRLTLEVNILTCITIGIKAY